MRDIKRDLLWKNISTLPYFRGFLRAVEGRYYDDIQLSEPILDLGIGDGHFSATTFPGRVLAGVDPTYKSLLEARTLNAARITPCAMGDNLPFPDGYFSTVISNSVLEHIPDLVDVLAEVKRVLRARGTFVICVPNDNFTKNLSFAVMLKKMRFHRAAQGYQRLFNKISRHFHADPVEQWEDTLRGAGFAIERSWNYFPPTSLSILEWGHLFGIPSWICKKILGQWVLVQKEWNLFPLYRWLKKHYDLDQSADNGAYSFFVMRKT